METPIGWILIGLWMIGVGFALLFGFRRFIRVYQMKWFDQSKSGPIQDMEWCEIRQAIKDDPIHWNKDQCCKTCFKWIRRCRVPCNYIFFDSIIVVGMLFLIFGSLCLILNNATDSGSFQIDNVALGAILAFIIGAVTVYYQINLKAKAENRQKWINQIREDISVLISNAPTRTTLSEQIEHTPKDTQLNFERLSLALNPSERIHRGMLAAIRFLYNPEQFGSGKKCDGYELCDECILSELRIKIEKGSYDRAKVKIVRLGNLLLKREWEQTKSVQ